MSARRSSPGLLVAILMLAVATAMIYVYFGVFVYGGTANEPLFLLMALGYFVGAGLIGTDIRGHLLLPLALGYLVLLVASWIPGASIGAFGTRDLWAYVDETLEAALVVLLVTEGERTAGAPQGKSSREFPKRGARGTSASG